MTPTEVTRGIGHPTVTLCAENCSWRYVGPHYPHPEPGDPVMMLMSPPWVPIEQAGEAADREAAICPDCDHRAHRLTCEEQVRVIYKDGDDLDICDCQTVAPDPAAAQFFRLYADAHRSDERGLRAATELSALAEDWFDQNTEDGWPLPRVNRAILAEPGE